MMPNKPKTPNHSVRIEDHIWDPAAEKAKRLNLTMTDVIERYLRGWGKRP